MLQGTSLDISPGTGERGLRAAYSRNGMASGRVCSFSAFQLSSAQSLQLHPTLCSPMDCSTPEEASLSVKLFSKVIASTVTLHILVFFAYPLAPHITAPHFLLKPPLGISTIPPETLSSSRYPHSISHKSSGTGLARPE